jgi:NAD(P)-dependent dehydrogenase (short-subunit alcohol dehydrogenase family)
MNRRRSPEAPDYSGKSALVTGGSGGIGGGFVAELLAAGAERVYAAARDVADGGVEDLERDLDVHRSRPSPRSTRGAGCDSVGDPEGDP